MKPYAEERTAQTNAKSTQFSMQLGEEQLSKISRLLITGQYRDPKEAALREILSNAYDANLEAQQKDGQVRPVDITVKKDCVVIRDYGEGLSEEAMQRLYTIIGKSTKENNEELIGAFGVGRLAPLALNDSFYISSYHSGQKSTYCCYLNESSIPAISLWGQTNSDEPTGLEVSIHFEESNTSDGDTYSKLKALVSGSRYKVRITYAKELLEDIEKQVKESYRQKVKKCALSIQELLKPALDKSFYFTTTDEETGLIVDFYLTSPKANSRNPNYIFDLGGALYPKTKPYERNYGLHWYYLLETQLDEFSSIPSPLEEESSKSTQDSQCKIELSPTCILRLDPGDLRLSTSREDLLLDEQMTKKQKEYIKAADRAVTKELQTRLDALCARIQTKGETLYEEIANFTTHLSSLRGKVESSIRSSTLTEQLAYTFNTSEGKKVTFTANTGYEAQDDTEIIVPLGSNRILLKDYEHSFLSFSDNNEYNLALRVALAKGYRQGINKRKPLKTCHLSSLHLCSFNCLLLCSDEEKITQKDIRTTFGEEALNHPMIVVSPLYHHELQAAPYINYLGLFKKEVKENAKPKEAKAPSKNVESSRLLRQIKATNDTTTLIDVYGKRGYSWTTPSDIFTPQLLQEKVIYVGVEETGFLKVLKKAPMPYVRSYYPYVLKNLSDNAIDKIVKLKSEGKCNWVSLEDVKAEIYKKIEAHTLLWLSVSASSELRQTLKSLKKDFKDHLPPQTFNFLCWTQELQNFYVTAAKHLSWCEGGAYEKQRLLPSIDWRTHSDLSFVARSQEEQVFGKKLYTLRQVLFDLALRADEESRDFVLQATAESLRKKE